MVIGITPMLLEEPEVSKAFIGDLASAYIFSAAAIVFRVINFIKSNKKQEEK